MLNSVLCRSSFLPIGSTPEGDDKAPSNPKEQKQRAEQQTARALSAATFDEARTLFHLLLNADECQMVLDIRSYDLTDAKFIPDGKNPRLHLLGVAGLAEKRPSVLRGDSIVATLEGTLINGYVHFVNLSDLRVSLPTRFCNNDVVATHVHFTLSRTALKLMHRAVDRYICMYMSLCECMYARK